MLVVLRMRKALVVSLKRKSSREVRSGSYKVEVEVPSVQLYACYLFLYK